MASKAYYKKKFEHLQKSNEMAKGLDAITIMFNNEANCVVIDNKHGKTAVLEGDDVTYFRKRLERVFKDCLKFEDSTKYE